MYGNIPMETFCNSYMLRKRNTVYSIKGEKKQILIVKATQSMAFIYGGLN
jgi:hypothetical protein